MPGNDSGDRVHNFFPHDKFLQGPHHQQTVEGTRSVANNNFLVGGQIGLPNTSTKNVNIQHSVTDRGQGSHASHGQSGLNFTQTTSNFGQNLFQRQQLNSNGYMFGNLVNQTRQDEANILAVDTIPDQRNLVSRGLSMYESHQGPGPQHQTKSLVGSDSSESPVTFNLFESQPQVPHPQSSMMQSFQKQQSGFSDMQQLQQQIMWRQMQELQKQQQLRQPDGRQQNAVNPISPFFKQLTGSYPSTLVNFPPRANSQNSRLGTESGNTNWLQRASSVVQGSSNGFVNSANHGQAQSSINLGAQEGDQSVYRDAHSGSMRNLIQFPEITVEKPSMEQVTAFANNINANQYQACIEQTSMQEEPMLPRQEFPSENSFSHPSGQTVQQANHVKRIASSQEIHLEVARSQEKTSSEDVASQNEVTLDPTEARILYGSEDNIWSAFGESLDDCGDAGAPLDNFQSGTWSALMQSAVAETSANDARQKEELGGLVLKNTSIHSENQTSTHSGRQDTSFHSDMPSPLHLSVHNPHSSLGVQQLGNNFSCEPGQRQGNLSQREGSNISSPAFNPVTDVRPTHQTVSRSGGPETNQVSYRGPWPPAQSGLTDQYGKSIVYNSVESASRFADATMHERENPSPHSQGYEQKAGTMGEVGHGGFLFDSCPMPSSTAEVEHAKSFSGKTSLTRGGFTISNATARPNLSTTQYNESNQAMLWRNVNPAIMSYGSGNTAHHYTGQENQTVDSSLNSRGKANASPSEMENCKRNNNSINSYCSDLSCNNSSGGVNENVMSDVGDLQSLLSREQKYFNHNKFGKTTPHPLKFQFHPMGNVDEDTLAHHGAKHSSHSLVSQQSTDFEGFNAYKQTPKGSVDLEKGQRADKNDANDINATCGNFPGHIQNATMPSNKHGDMCTPDKDTLSSSQNMLELIHKIDQLRGQGLLIPSSPSGGHNVSSELPKTENSGSSASCLQQNNTSTAQGFGLQLGPPSHRSALPSQSFTSQGSLQKGMNSHQGQDASEIGGTGPSQLPSSPAVQSLPPLSGRSVSAFNHNRSVFPEQVIHKMPGSYLSTSSSDCPRSRSQFQYQQVVMESGELSKKQHDVSNSIQKNDMVSRSSSVGQPTETTFHNEKWNPQHDDSDLLKGSTNQISVPESHLRGLVPPTSAKDVPVSQAMNDIAQQGTSFEMLPNRWSSIPGQPHLFGSQNHMTSSNALQFHQPNVLESNSFTPHKHGEQESIVGRSSPSVSGSSSMNNKGSPVQQDSTGKINMAHRDEWQRPEPPSNNFRDGSPSNSVSMQNDLEAFGRSLLSSNSSHQNYSLLHQMRIIKSAETDPNERARKRMKSSGSVEECQQLISKAAKFSDEAVGQHTSVSSGDSKLLSFSGLKDNAGSKEHAQLGNVISHNIHSSSREDSQFNHDGNIPTPVKVDHPYNSPQMTPSWLNQYGGGFRNGQMLTECDARRGTASKTAELLFSHGKTYSGVHMSNSNEQVAAAGISPGQIVNIHQSPIPISSAVEPQPLVLNVTRSKKRERATFQLTSWRKEVMQGSRNPQTISMAEVNWAKAANRLTEKIEDEVKFSEDGLLMLKAKRRITLSTQLMQQLLSPPKSAILSSEAELNYDGVAYSVSRLALGEACGLLPNLNSDSDKSHPSVSLFSGKDNELEKANDRPVLKSVKGFMGRTQKLESDFLRLNKRASLLGVKSECQELEKFSVINRFAKFHGRGQAETGNASSSSNGAANALRPYPQRYVTALPVPRSLPDRVHCLSL